MDQNSKIINNLKVMNKEIDTIEEAVKRRYLLNKSHLMFLLDLQNLTQERYYRSVIRGSK